jgi:hypothetical protein
MLFILGLNQDSSKAALTYIVFKLYGFCCCAYQNITKNKIVIYFCYAWALILCIRIDNFIFYSFTKFWVTLSDTVVELVDQFRYLGSIITEYGETDVDVAALINSAHFVFYQLKSIWSTTKFFRSLYSYMDLKHRRSPTPSSQGCRCFSTDIYKQFFASDGQRL